MLFRWLFFSAAAVAIALQNPLSAADRKVVQPFESSAALGARSSIDRAVFSKLKELDIEPANVCSDAVFVRRVYLDLLGTLPPPEEVMRFLADRNPQKRRALIDDLLDRDEFAEYWAMKWSDLLRVKAEFPINLWPNAVQAYHQWIRTSIKANMPYDKFVREMLTGSGSNFRKPQVNFYRSVRNRQPRDTASAVALTFMGVRTERWPTEQLDAMSVFFSRIGFKRTAEWKEEIVYFDRLKPLTVTEVKMPDGMTVTIPPDRDPREVFADWLIRPQNPWFTQNIVNRVWYWLLGRGIIEPPDDIRTDNAPTNPELLDLLRKELISADYDLKQVFRSILNSRAYQLSSIAQTDHPDAETYFAYYTTRRLDAEVLIDAICQITGTTEQYSSAIPEPFTWIPEHQRSISLADGSITSPFLEMFGRPPRDTGLESERSNTLSGAQRLHILNSSHILTKLERGPKLQALIQSSKSLPETVTKLYLTILSRFPTEAEMRAVAAYAHTSELGTREVAVDTAWALINSAEFLYRH